jgi:hypothetical protein
MVAATHVKSLGHIRTKSSPALSSLLQAGALKAAATAQNTHRILGEVNVNLKVVHKDDSEVGKVSPGKLSNQKDWVKQAPVAALARPAARPLAIKSSLSQKPLNTTNVVAQQSKAHATAASNSTEVQFDQVKKVAPKKSTKVLRDVQPAVELEVKSSLDSQTNTNAITSRPTESISTSTRHVSSSSAAPAVAVPKAIATTSAPVTSVKSDGASVAQHEKSRTAAQPRATSHAPSSYEVDDVEDALDSDGYTTARSWGLSGDLTNGHTTVFNPRCTEKVQAELDAAAAHVLATRSVDDIEEEYWDTSMVAEYGDEIFSYMHELEVRMAPNPFYMDQQTEIQWSMRGVLVDWVVQVHQRFNLLPETLFLTINYIDRFLSCKIVSLGKLQLVGATAIFIAAKYEEVNCPTLSEIIYMVDNGYTADELLKAERFMLSMLQFELGWPGPMSFLRRISKADDYDLETRTLAKYFLEVTIMDERFIGCTPSYLAAGAHCMARLLLRKGDWSAAHVYYSNYTLAQLYRLLKALLDCCQAARIHHRTVYEKYTDRRYKKSSIFVREQLAAGFQLPVMIRGTLGSVVTQPLWQ